MILPLVDDGDLRIYCGDALDVLRELPDQSVHAVMTSPPFYGLRDYGTGTWEGGDPDCKHSVGSQVADSKAKGAITSGVRPGVDASRCRRCGANRIDQQLGLERTPDEWAAALVEVFGEARRVLRDDGTLWLEVGDGYSSQGGGKEAGEYEGKRVAGADWQPPRRGLAGLKEKDLIGAPWMVAVALRADGWWLRGAYVWEKPDAMPESVQDRCTISHSFVFHLSKSARYYFDLDAIREPFSDYGRDAGNTARTRLSEDAGTPAGSGKNVARGFPFAYPEEPVAQLDLDGQEAEPEVRGPDGRREFHLEKGPNSEQARDGSRWPSLEGRSPRSVWRITTEASSFGLCPVCRTYWDARAPETHCGVDVVGHFAVWPHELVGKIIACSTSEAGCCADCGAPRIRQVERTAVRPDKSQRTTSHYSTFRYGAGNGGNEGLDQLAARMRAGIGRGHAGWESSCGCAGETVPCVVLDVFGGSGTTGRQARRMGRQAILIELNPDYAEIAAHRTAQQGLLA